MGRNAVKAFRAGRAGRGDSGFTLVEVLIVIGIAAILLSILALGVRQVSASFALRRAGTVALSEVRRAQARALAERVDYTVEFVIGNPGALRVYRETTLDRTVQPPQNWPASAALVDEGGSPPGFPDGTTGWLADCDAAGPGNPANKCITFQFMGAPESVGAQPKGAVLVRGCSSHLWVTVAAGTGKVSVER
jgi:prepilin-type N-terminal cleavage/methylation domain-containing protein